MYCVQIKYNFEYYQYSREKIAKQRELMKDEKWTPPPLCTVNVSIFFSFVGGIHHLKL